MFQHGQRTLPAVIITFDDGYADNLYNAKPLLERFDLPATVFVTSGYVGACREFWYDELEKILLHAHPLPERLRLQIKGQEYEWRIDALPEESADHWSEWDVSAVEDPTLRHSVYRSLCEILQPLLDPERRGILDHVASWAGIDICQRSTHRTLSPQELIRLEEGALIEIGAHTVSHPVLSTLPIAAQISEISCSKTQLEEILSRDITAFAYPFGTRSHYTDETVNVVRQTGFKWACSNFPGITYPITDRWQLPRFIVRNWTGEQFARKLTGWLES